MKRTEILQRFGPEGITGYVPAYGGIGKITDDTQMTLFTAEGLLRGWVSGRSKGTTNYAAATAQAYMRWLLTQGEKPACDMSLDLDEPGWLYLRPELHSQRAPGYTCMSALRAMETLGEGARNDSKGCGGVMRVAPVGLFTWRLQESIQETFRLGAELAALTHGHPTGYLTAGVLSVLIRALAEGTTLTDGLELAKHCLQSAPDHKETLQAIRHAEGLATDHLPGYEAVASLGEGWIAEEALVIAVYCALVAQDFKEGVLMAVNHDGDTDSTGSIAGNLLGTLFGVGSIPAEWLEPLELRDVISEVADNLYDFREWKIGEHSGNDELNQRIWQKYPGH